MSNDLVEPEVVAKRIAEIVKKACKDNGLPPEREVELASAMFAGMFMGPTGEKE